MFAIKQLTPRVWNDPHLLSVYTLERFGTVLTYGGSYGRYLKGRRFARRVADLMGVDVEEVIEHIQNEVWADTSENWPPAE